MKTEILVWKTEDIVRRLKNDQNKEGNRQHGVEGLTPSPAVSSCSNRHRSVIQRIIYACGLGRSSAPHCGVEI